MEIRSLDDVSTTRPSSPSSSNADFGLLRSDARIWQASLQSFPSQISQSVVWRIR